MSEADSWPDEVAFLPFIGPGYDAGIGGVRVLLLGESHYRADGVDHSPRVTRRYTRDVFADRIEPIRLVGEGRYFKPLDRMLTGVMSPTPTEAAARWREVAFANVVQQFVGVQPGDRPTSAQFCHGTHVLIHHVLPRLQPQVIVVLGRAAWNGLAAGDRRTDLDPYMAESVRAGYERVREVWALRFRDGLALMSWTYHPSRGIDHANDLAGLLRHLLTSAGRHARAG